MKKERDFRDLKYPGYYWTVNYECERFIYIVCSISGNLLYTIAINIDGDRVTVEQEWKAKRTRHFGEMVWPLIGSSKSTFDLGGK